MTKCLSFEELEYELELYERNGCDRGSVPLVTERCDLCRFNISFPDSEKDYTVCQFPPDYCINPCYEFGVA